MSAAAFAEQDTPSFSVEFIAPAGCPERQVFVGWIRERAPAAVENTSVDARFSFRIELGPAAEGFEGKLAISTAGGGEFTREVPAASCSEVLASMAVIASMVLERAGETRETEEAPHVTRRSGLALAAPRPDPPRVRRRSASPTQRAAASPARAVGSSSGPHLGAALLGGLQTGVAPSAAFALAAGADLVFGADEQRAPSARLSAVLSQNAVAVTPSGDARFQLLGAELSGCPSRLPAKRFGLRACGLFTLGSLRGESSDTPQDRSRRMLWLGFGASARLEASLSRTVGTELELSVVRLIRNDRFVFDTGYVAHDVPQWALGARVGALLRSP